MASPSFVKSFNLHFRTWPGYLPASAVPPSLPASCWLPWDNYNAISVFSSQSDLVGYLVSWLCQSPPALATQIGAGHVHPPAVAAALAPCFGVCHANSNGMLNVYLRSSSSSSSKGRSSGWAWHWPQLFCRFLHIANDAKDTAQCCQATVATLLFLSHSFTPSLSPSIPYPRQSESSQGEYFMLLLACVLLRSTRLS